MKRLRTPRANLGIAESRICPGSTAAYGFAILCVAVASLLHWAIGLISEDTQYPAVLFAALVGGAQGLAHLLLIERHDCLVFYAPARPKQ